MHWSDQAIILSAHKFSEHSAVVRVFSEDHGICAGAVRGAFSKKQRPVFERGNLVKAEWSARLAEHLGTLRCELLQPMAAFFMADQAKLLALQSAIALIDRNFAERDPHPALYRAFWGFLQEMKFGGPWLPSFVKLELLILSEAGFGLELERCAATGQCEDLIYVSPKSGKAVCAQAGEPYKERLLPLPAFLQNDDSMIRLFDHSKSFKAESSSHRIIESSQILDGLRLTGYFLETRLSITQGGKMPDARHRIIAWLQKEKIDHPAPLAEAVLETI